jgi:hypothetical protein
MAFEVNNLAAPYNAVAYIKVWFSQQDYEADKANGFNPATKHWSSGSGVLIGIDGLACRLRHDQRPLG